MDSINGIRLAIGSWTHESQMGTGYNRGLQKWHKKLTKDSK